MHDINGWFWLGLFWGTFFLTNVINQIVDTVGFFLTPRQQDTLSAAVRVEQALVQVTAAVALAESTLQSFASYDFPESNTRIIAAHTDSLRALSTVTGAAVMVQDAETLEDANYYATFATEAAERATAVCADARTLFTSHRRDAKKIRLRQAKEAQLAAEKARDRAAKTATTTSSTKTTPPPEAAAATQKLFQIDFEDALKHYQSPVIPLLQVVWVVLFVFTTLVA